MTEVVLVALNARAIHASLGSRYLLANMGDLRPRTALVERTIDDRATDVVEAILSLGPRVVGLGVYVWNVERVAEIVGLLRQVAPDVSVVLGGPEVSHELQDQPLVQRVDYVITGEGDLAFPALCRQLLAGARPASPVIAGGSPELGTLAAPYGELCDDDLRWRFVYVEASRGCPYRCSFCLSALDREVRAFPMGRLLEALDALYRRGARHFRFVDRTFNLHPEAAVTLLRFWLDRMTPELFVHFEMVPDRFPDALKEVITAFPPGSIQFEVGIQTLDAAVSRRIARPLRVDRVEANLRWLRANTSVHLHTDLIVGLPGEDLRSFGRGFSRLVALQPQEIQVGVLKRLRGAPITALTDRWGMVYSPSPPYEVVQTGAVGFVDMQRLKRFARVWELVANRGSFPATVPLVLDAAETPFEAVLALSDWLVERDGRVHGLSLLRLAERLLEWLQPVLGDTAREAVLADYVSDGRRRPSNTLLGTTARRAAPRTTVRHARQRDHAHRSGPATSGRPPSRKN